MMILWLVLFALLLIAIIFFAFPYIRRRKKLHLQTIDRIVLISIFLLFPILSFSLYIYLGSSKQLAEAQLVKEAMKQPEQLIAALKTKLNDHSDAKGWFLLGKLYFSMQRMKEARDAFYHAYQLNHDDPQILTFTAMTAFLSQDYSTAIECWQILLTKVPANSPEAKRIHFALAKAKGKLHK